MNNNKLREGSRKMLPLVSIALVALLGSAVQLYAVESETFRDTVNSEDGILVDSVTPAKPLAFPGTNAAEGIVPAAPAQTTPAVTSKVVTVANRKYTVYDYDDPATKKFCVVIPEGLKTGRMAGQRAYQHRDWRSLTVILACDRSWPPRSPLPPRTSNPRLGFLYDSVRNSGLQVAQQTCSPISQKGKIL